MGYRDRRKKPETPNVEFDVNPDYCNVFGVMSALEEDEEVREAGERTNYRQPSEGESDKEES